MSETIRADARHIRKLIREAEALSDEAMIACSRLKQAIVSARMNPELPVYAGQKAIVRLVHAESQALSLSTNLLRVHDELSKDAQVFNGGDEVTDVAPSAIAMDVRASVDA